jgi:hypothetical protein
MGFRDAEVSAVMAGLAQQTQLQDAPIQLLLREALVRIRPSRAACSRPM